MKKLPVVLLLILSFTSCKNKAEKSTDNIQKNGEVTTYYLIRHAEKKSGKDPELTPQGQERAVFWAGYFKNDSLDAAYSTDTRRTIATATPTAEEFGLTVKKYEPADLVDEAFKKQTSGKKVLIVGHSDTTPMIANQILGNKKYKDIPMSEFGRVYIIKVKNGKAQGEIKTLNELEKGLP